MPEWAQFIHEWLPLESMADAMRFALLPENFNMTIRSWIVLVVWGIIAIIAAELSLQRRD